MMNKIFSRIMACAVAGISTAAFMPVEPLIMAYAESGNEISFEDSLIAVYSGNDILLNEKSVEVAGGVYCGGDLKYTGNEDNFSVNGVNASAEDGTDCILPDYTELINSAEKYDFEFSDSKTISDSYIDLTNASMYSDGNLNIAHAELTGSGRISAADDVNMSIAGTDELKQAFIMSESGNINIDAAELEYNGIIYAPEGKVKINAKHISLSGAIYADEIEINGTSFKAEYKDFFGISCRAHTENVLYVHKNDLVSLSGYVSDERADFMYKVSESQKDKVSLSGENTLTPELRFTEAGEYNITLTATLGNKQSSDIVKVIVTDGPVVRYTSTKDFSYGSVNGMSSADDELKLSPISDEKSVTTKKYSLNSESGISVSDRQSKTNLNTSGDELELDYSLEGYGKLETGNGNDVVLCIDNSGSVSSMIPTIKAAALQIIESMGPNDRLAITSLDRLNTPLTSDKETLIAAFEAYNLGGGSEFGNGLKIVNEQIFDEESENRNKFVFLLADGENGYNSGDDAVAMEQAAVFRANGTKVYAFEINPFSYDFSDTSTVQNVAIETNGAYKLCPDSEAIEEFLLNMAETIYNLAARNVTFTTTVKNAEWVKNGSMTKAPDSAVYNDDGSVTLSWNYSAFEIGAADEIGLKLKTGLISDNGYINITTDTKLISYDSNGKGSVLYLDDIIAESGNCSDSGKWTSKVYDSGKDNCSWSYVKWNADYYGDSAIDIFLSTSNDGVNFSDRIRLTNGQRLALSGRYVRTEIEMKKSHDGATPVLYDFTLYSDDVEATDICTGTDAVIRGAHNVPAGTPVSMWLDVEGNYDNVTEIRWDTNSGETISDESNPLRRTLVFKEEGEYTVSAVVIAGGIETRTAVKINVLPETVLWQEIEKDEFKAVKLELTDTPEYATQYNEPLTFNILFENPEQVAWVRALYTNPKVWGEGNYRIAFIDEQQENLVSVPLPGTNLAETTIIVEAYDWYGNMVSESRTIKMDRQAPTVYVNSDKSRVYPGNEAVITVTYSDNDELASLKLFCNDEEVAINDEGQYIFSRDLAGDYIMKAVAVDNAGNVSEAARTITVIADERLPYVYIGGSSRIIIGNSTDLKITAYDNETKLTELLLTVQLEGEDEITEIFDLNSSKETIERETIYTFTPQTTGKYVFTATATDREGNVNTYTFTENVVADTIGPNINIELSKYEILAGDSIDVSVAVTDDVAVADVRFFIDDVETELTEDNTFHYVSDDENIDNNGKKRIVFKVIATDTSGNERSGSKTLLVETEDTVLPNVNISAGSRYEYQSENAYMTVTASDNIGVESLKVIVNGEPAELDENGRYYFDTSEITEYFVEATAVDTSGNERKAEKTIAVSDTRKPDIRFTPDKSGYDTNDSPVISVEVSDNYQLDTVTASIDGKEINTDNGSFTYTIENAPAGSYVITVTAADIFGNTQTSSYTVRVRDTIVPEITAFVNKETFAKGEVPEITCEYSDNVAVTRIVADMNGISLEVDTESGKVIMPETIDAGDKTVTIKAYDAAYNVSEPAVVSFFMSSSEDIEAPVIEEISVVPDIIRAGNDVTVTIKASDNSGEVNLTVLKDGSELKEDAESGNYSFTADSAGEVNLVVRAEDPSGNYIEKEVVLKVYRNTENRKMTADAPAVVKPGEEITVILSSADGIPFDTTELWLNEQDMSAALTQNADGKYQTTFTLDSNGTYSFKAIGRDDDGYESEALFTIQVAAAYENELKTEEMQASLVQTSETELNDEIKELVGTFESPADAYEYVYNNINFEAYTNSRRGAVGAFELKRGNDVDQASLLIGMLREMGYPARYANTDVMLTSEQVTSLMAMDNFIDATNIIASSGKNAGLLTMPDGSEAVKINEVFVQVYVPASELGETDEALKDLGVWVNLDTSIKVSSSFREQIKAETQEELDVSAYRESVAETGLGKILDGLEAKADSFTEKTGNSLISDMFSGPLTVTSEGSYAYSRPIVQQEFNRLPDSLNYVILDENIKGFNAVPMSMADTVQFAVSNNLSGKNLGTYKISEIYNKRVTLRFDGNTGSGTVFEMGKSAIYSNTFLPSLYIDGEVAAQYTLSEHSSNSFFDPEDEYYFIGNDAWRLGEHCKISTQITTNGRTTSWTDDAVIGSTYAIAFDTGGITESQYYSSLYDAAELNGIDVSDPNAPAVYDSAYAEGSTDYYNEEKIGSYLDFAGKYYLLNCDSYGSICASLNNMETSTDTKVVMTNYTIGSVEDTITGNTINVIPGRFQIDVSYNNCYGSNRNGNQDIRNQYMFNTSYMESYLEGWVWDMLLFNEGASTVSAMNNAVENGANLLVIDSGNVDSELGKADITAEERNEIVTSAANGYSIIIPDKRSNMNDWSGIGYIIADFKDYNHFVFKISGGLNGGSDTDDVDLLGETIAKRLENVNTEKLFSGLLSTSQSLYYFLLQINLTKEVAPAVSTLAAASGGGVAAVFVGGMQLYGAVTHLVDIVNYRTEMLEILYEYCMADDKAAQDQSCVDMMVLVVKMVKDLIDTLKGQLEEPGSPEDELNDAIEDYIEAVLDLILPEEEDDGHDGFDDVINDAVDDAVSDAIS